MGWFSGMFKKQPPSPVSQEECSIQSASRCVDVYGDLLAKTIGAGMPAAPESLLPDSKELIMKCLKIEALQAVHAGDEQLLDTYATSYGLLAHFLPQSEVSILVEMNKAHAKGLDAFQEFVLSPAGNRAMDLKKQVHENFARLSIEMEQFIASCKKE